MKGSEIERAKRWKEQDDADLCIRYCQDGERQIGPGRIGDHRISKYVTTFVGIRTVTGKSVSHAITSLANFEDAVLKLQEGKVHNGKRVFATSYRKDMIKALGRFWCFEHLKERTLEYAPPEIKKLTRYQPKINERQMPKEVIEEPELKEMVEVCKGDALSPAIISTLFYTGVRIGEFLALRIKDIEIDGHDVTIFVSQGKTGERKIPVIAPLPDLVRWVDYRKATGAPDTALLWVSPRTKKPLGGPAIAKKIRRIVQAMNERRAKRGAPKYTKEVNPHNIGRHSCATLLSVKYHFTEEQLRAYFGWSKGSDMPATYVRMGFDQLKRVVASKRTGQPIQEDAKILICPNCKKENPTYAVRCCVCGYDFERKKAVTNLMSMQAQIEELEKRVAELSGKRMSAIVRTSKKA
jgi:integrase/ribosomal protein L40E